MGVAEREKKYREELAVLEDPASQCEYLMFLGMQGQKRKPCERIFTGLRGVLAIPEDLYEGESPEAVRAHPPKFPGDISDEVIYPEIKKNGILKCYQRLAALE